MSKEQVLQMTEDERWKWEQSLACEAWADQEAEREYHNSHPDKYSAD